MSFNKNKSKKKDKKALFERSAKLNNDIMNNNNYSYYYYPLYNKNKIKKVIPNYFNIKKPNKKAINKTKKHKSLNNNEKQELKNLVNNNNNNDNKNNNDSNNNDNNNNDNNNSDNNNNDNNNIMDCQYYTELKVDIKKEDIDVNVNDNNNNNNNTHLNELLTDYCNNEVNNLPYFSNTIKNLNSIKQENICEDNISSILYSLYINKLLNNEKIHNNIDNIHSIPIINNNTSEENLLLLNNLYYQSILSRHHQKFNMLLKNFNSNLNLINNKKINNNLNNFNQNDHNIDAQIKYDEINQKNEEIYCDNNTTNLINSNDINNTVLNKKSNNIDNCNNTEKPDTFIPSINFYTDGYNNSIDSKFMNKDHQNEYNLLNDDMNMNNIISCQNDISISNALSSNFHSFNYDISTTSNTTYLFNQNYPFSKNYNSNSNNISINNNNNININIINNQSDNNGINISENNNIKNNNINISNNNYYYKSNSPKSFESIPLTNNEIISNSNIINTCCALSPNCTLSPSFNNIPFVKSEKHEESYFSDNNNSNFSDVNLTSIKTELLDKKEVKKIINKKIEEKIKKKNSIKAKSRDKLLCKKSSKKSISKKSRESKSLQNICNKYQYYINIDDNNNESVSVKECSNCHTRITPTWRRGKNDNLLCNACGLYEKQNNKSRPFEKLENGLTKLFKDINTIKHVCSNCKTVKSPTWRKGLQGQILCNACGLFLKQHNIDRPCKKDFNIIN